MSSESLPVPAGWYCLLPSNELPANEVITVTFAGRDVVVFRTRDGSPAVLDATCPHLGAHLGRGGRIEGDTIRCPFHGFCFDATGRCVSTPYGRKAPPKAVLDVHPAREVDGLVLAWFHPTGAAPTFDVPQADATGFSASSFSTVDIAGHPQETTENSVDLGHLSIVHGYHDVEELAPIRTDGAFLNTRYRFRYPRTFVSTRRDLTPEIDVHVWGLGFSRVELTVPQVGVRSRLWVLPVPTSPGRITLRVGASAKRIGPKSAIHPVFALLPASWIDSLLGRIALRSLVGEVAQDIPIWANKRYLPRPALADGDGPVGPYRRWVKQFYEGGSAHETKTKLPVVPG